MKRVFDCLVLCAIACLLACCFVVSIPPAPALSPPVVDWSESYEVSPAQFEQMRHVRPTATPPREGPRIKNATHDEKPTNISDIARRPRRHIRCQAV